MEFVPETVLKRDIFSETIVGHLAEDPACKVVLRKLDGVPWYARPIAWFLARKEVRGLRAVAGIEGVPELLRVDRVGLLRSWSQGTPLQLAKPDSAAWYHDAKRLLREMRARGVAHNDIAKPQNWLMTPEGRAAVIDFQLASVHPRKGRWFRLLAREDLRHLLKQKRAFAPGLLVPSERRVLAKKSLPSRIWMATGKRAYNFVTRRLMNCIKPEFSVAANASGSIRSTKRARSSERLRSRSQSAMNVPKSISRSLASTGPASRKLFSMNSPSFSAMRS